MTAARRSPLPVPHCRRASFPTRWPGGQTIYVPVYSHIYSRDELRTFDLTVTLSMRNTDREQPIVLTSVSYYDTSGRP